MKYQLRYRPDTDLGRLFPSIRFPWRNTGWPTREHAEEVRVSCVSASKMEIVEVPNAGS